MKNKIIFPAIILSMIFLFILLAAILPANAQKTSEMMVEPYYYSNNQPMVANQFYSVVFDEEGEATVMVKINVVNIEKTDLDELNIEIPGTSVRIINSIQEHKESIKTCSRWEEKCVKLQDENCVEYKKECSNWYYRQNQPVYYKIDPDVQPLSRSTTVKFKLPKEVRSQEMTTIIIYYKAVGYVEKSAGVYNFDFESIKIPYDVDSVRVAVNVGGDLKLKGGESSISYLPNFGGFGAAKALSSSEAVASDQLSSLSSQIEYQRGFVKQTAGFDPFESFHVTGKYSKSSFFLHAGSLFLWILVAIGAIVAIIFAVRAITRKISQKNLTLKIILSGIFSTIGLIVLWVIVFVLMKGLRNWVGYQYVELFSILIVLISILVTILLIICPSIYFGVKHGAMKGLWAFISFVISLTVLGTITLVLFISLRIIF